jgi:hypothetical protein
MRNSARDEEAVTLRLVVACRGDRRTLASTESVACGAATDASLRIRGCCAEPWVADASGEPVL